MEWILGEEWSQTGEKSLKPLNIFVSYSQKNDTDYLERLCVNLKPKERARKIIVQHDQHFIAGSNLDNLIKDKLENTDVFVCILSEDYLASDYCQKELNYAREQARKGMMCVVGIVARPCAWREVFPGNLLVLPKSAKPIIKWKPQDDAWLNITSQLDFLCEKLSILPKPWPFVSDERVEF